jgi:hypothetical protein
MPKVFSVIDVKPVNFRVVDTKPNSLRAVDVKPNMNRAFEETVIYTDTRTINKGQPMGLLLSLTYPTTFTFTSSRL